MTVAVLTLSEAGAPVAARVAAALPGAELHVHRAVAALPGATRFDRVADRLAELWGRVEGAVCVMPSGVVVRAVAPLLAHKLQDPAVVVVDVGGRWAVSLVSGHEGGANDLAYATANALGAEPVVTTTSEAARSLVVGVGCRRGTSADAIAAAVEAALARAGAGVEEVRLLASAAVKGGEPGLVEAAQRLGLALRFVADDEIRAQAARFEPSAFVQSRVNLPAVAEPAALLAGRRTSLLLPKQVFPGVTVAIAREASLS